MSDQCSVKHKRNIKSERTALYRAYSGKGELLYVGISLSVFTRLSSHKSSSAWFDSLSDITVEWYPDRGAAADAEEKAIHTEYPIFNIAGAVAKPEEDNLFINVSGQSINMLISNVKLYQRLVGKWITKYDKEPNLIMSLLYRRKAELNVSAYRTILRRRSVRRWPEKWLD